MYVIFNAETVFLIAVVALGVGVLIGLRMGRRR